MRNNEITEMTMRGPSYEKLANKYAMDNSARWKNDGQYIADIEDYKVLKNNGHASNVDHYSLWDNDELVAFATLSNDNVVDGVWVNPLYRGQKIFSAMLWFFKTRLNRSPLILGDIHSTDMQEVVKGLSRFNKSWVNTKTNDVEPFDLKTLDQFYSYTNPTAWRLILENSGEFNDWPMFKGNGFIKESYFSYVE
jgi:hypothetical protein